MKTLTKEMQQKITPELAVDLLKKGNERFVNNLKINRNLIQQVNDTSESQHPFAVVISCMDSRTSPELIFDQGLGDIFSIRIAGNIVNEEIIGSTEFGCKIVGAKLVIVLGHSKCGAITGAINDVELGHLHFITRKIQRCIPHIKSINSVMDDHEYHRQVTKMNVQQGITDLKAGSHILEEMNHKGEIKIIGGIYDVSTGLVEFIDMEKNASWGVAHSRRGFKDANTAEGPL